MQQNFLNTQGILSTSIFRSRAFICLSVSVSVSRFLQFLAYLGIFKLVYTSLNTFESIEIILNLFGYIWIHLNPFGIIWIHLKSFEFIWIHLIANFNTRALSLDLCI